MKKRIISILLMVVMLFGMVPISAHAIGVEAIEKQIINTYSAACKKANVSSFNGYCAWFVNWELVILGINASYVGGNGNDEFDNYMNLEKSNGGYYVNAYPASKYNLKAALNEITNGGSIDATNILVGFEKGSGSDGAKYGHVVFIHAIIDGIVFFSESFNVGLGGINYKEGAVIACSIDAFANYYNAWTVLDGVIHFQKERGYLDKCTPYLSHCKIKITKDACLMSLPCSSGVNADSAYIEMVSAGKTLNAIGLYMNDRGNLWYKVVAPVSGKETYVPSSHTSYQGKITSDVKISGVSAPTALKAGERFSIKGEIKATVNKLSAVSAFVYPGTNTSGTASTGRSVNVNTNSYQLYNSDVDMGVEFNKLKAGSYNYVVKAKTAKSYYAKSEKVLGEVEPTEIILHQSVFTVGDASAPVTYTISYNANGGSGAPASQTKTYGQTLVLSKTVPTRSGYTFLGWSTSPSATSATYPAGGSYTVNASATLYAVWKINTVSTHTVKFNANGGNLPTAYMDNNLDGINVARASGYLVVYNNSGSLVDTNKYGVEVSVDAAGKVIGMRDYLSESKSTVPSGGFVLSGQAQNGTWVQNISIGDYVAYDSDTMKVFVYESQEAYEAHHKRVTNGDKMGVLPVPIRSGYVFDGWYTSSTGGTKVNSNTAVTANMTLYAHWTAVCASGHDYHYVYWILPSTTETGAIRGDCMTCFNTNYVVLPVLNTKDYTYTVIKEPTSAAKGTGRYTWNVTEYGTFYFDVTLDKLPEQPKVLLGDINDDGQVTILDLMRLANHFANSVAINEANADVNGDGQITILDLMRLANYFAGNATLG